MHLKTFHASSIQDAIRRARQQLGPDAMLLNSRRVTAANEAPAVFAVTFAAAAPVAAPEAGQPGGDHRPENQHQALSQNQATNRKQSGNGALAMNSMGTEAAPSSPHSAGQARPARAETDAAGSPQAAPFEREGAFEREGTAVSTGKETGKPAGTRAVKGGSKRNREVQPGVSSVAKAAPSEEPASLPETGTGAFQSLASQSSASLPSSDLNADLPGPALPSYEKLFEQMTSMRREMLQLAGSVRRASAASYRQELASEELKWAYDVLVAQDFCPELIEEVIEDLEPRLGAISGTGNGKKKGCRQAPRAAGPQGEAGLLALLRESLGARIELRPEPGLRRRTGKPQLVVLVGPPGVGKTTTLVKLAGRYGLHSRFPLQIISMDNYRVAAAEQLRTYASVLGVGFDALPSAAALEKALRQYEAKELILIDTPGYGWRDFPAAEDLAALLREQEQASVHLVLSASMKPADLSRVVDLYEVFAYNSMLFTKLDETSTVGCLVSESWIRRKPLSYLCAGQRIPDDIEVASREQILQRMLPASLSSDEFAA